MCEDKATKWDPQVFIDPSYMHVILLKDVLQSTQYFCHVEIDQYGWSEIYSFTNRPPNNEQSFI